MNIGQANILVRLLLRDIYMFREKKMIEQFPDCSIRVPFPTFESFAFEECLDFIYAFCSVDPVSHEERAPHFLDDYRTCADPIEAFTIATLKAIALRHNIDYNTSQSDSCVIREGRRVQASASRYDDVIFVGTRHGSPAMSSQMWAVKEDRLLAADKRGKAEQGFIDQHDIFMTREEAFEVALAAGQINNYRLKHCVFGRLHSEDVF